MNPVELTWQNRRGLKIVGRSCPPPGGPRGVVALVHGLGEHIRRYEHVADALNRAGYGMIGFDLAGHGRSEGSRGFTSYDETLELIDHTLREAEAHYPGLPRFLYGHSLGGALVLYYALKRRPALNGFIVTSPGLAPGQPVSQGKLLLAKVMAALYPAYSMPNGLDPENISHERAVIQAYKDDPLVHPKISAKLGLDLVTKGAWVIEQAVHFPGPLLLAHGDADTLVQTDAIRAFAKKVPADKLTYKVWPGLYHETHNEIEKEQVIQYMTDWIVRHS